MDFLEHNNSSLISTPTKGNSLEYFLHKLYFPDNNIRLGTVNNWYPEVRIVQLEDGREFIAKTFHAASKILNTLRILQKWTANINKSSEIIAPQFLPTIEGEYFSLIKTGKIKYIAVMTKITFQPFELNNLNDFKRMGKAVALLHKAAEHIDTKQLKQFRFSKTNTSVEKFWHLQTFNEILMFKKILHYSYFPNSLPWQLTHNDLHPENLLSQNRIPVFIDFDQALVSPRINDIGQALSAFWIDESIEGFVLAKSAFVRGYNLVSPLTIDEIYFIPLFALRKACISFVWFKGIAQEGDRVAFKWYERILKRAHILEKYLEKNGYYSR